MKVYAKGHGMIEFPEGVAGELCAQALSNKTLTLAVLDDRNGLIMDLLQHEAIRRAERADELERLLRWARGGER